MKVKLLIGISIGNTVFSPNDIINVSNSQGKQLIFNQYALSLNKKEKNVTKNNNKSSKGTCNS